jgi:hypothetical protein
LEAVFILALFFQKGLTGSRPPLITCFTGGEITTMISHSGGSWKLEKEKSILFFLLTKVEHRQNGKI